MEGLERVAIRHPIAMFDGEILLFLESLQASQPAPALAQLEAGRVDGLSRVETEQLKQRVGFPR